MTREEITQLFERRNELADRYDIPGLMQLYAETSIVESPLAGGAITGRAAHADLLAAFVRGIPDVRFTVDETYIDGHRVAQVGMLTGTDTGSFMGLPPTGRPFSLPIVILYTVKDGLIVHERRIYDFTGLLVQIGVLKQIGELKPKPV